MNISQTNDSTHKIKNTLRNTGFGIISKISNVLFPFIIRTIMLQKMGAEYVGIGSLFTSILQVLSVAELGIASAINFCLYKPVAEGDVDEINRIMVFYKTVYAIIGSVILGIGICLCPFIPHLVKGDCPNEINIYLLYLIYLMNTVLSYFVYGYKHSVFLVFQRSDILNKVELLICVIRSCLQIFVLAVSQNYYLYIIFLPVFTVVSNCIINCLSIKRYPEIQTNNKYSLSGIKKISKQLKGVAIGRISLVCRNSFDSIIISSFLGLTATAIYSNYYYVISSISSILSVFLVSMCASVGNSLVLRSLKQNSMAHLQYDFYYQVIVSWILMMLTGVLQAFVKLWAGDDLLVSNFTMSLFCMYFYVNNMAQVRSVYSEAAGIWWEFRYLTLGEMVLNLLLNFLLGYYFGMNGILIATIITAFLCSYIGITIVTYKKLFKCSSKQYFFNNTVYLIVSLVGCAFTARINLLWNVTNYTQFIVLCLKIGIFSLIYLFAIYVIIGYTRKYIKDAFSLLLNCCR